MLLSLLLPPAALLLADPTERGGARLAELGAIGLGLAVALIRSGLPLGPVGARLSVSRGADGLLSLGGAWRRRDGTRGRRDDPGHG
ncbi:MAG TPA: hypothetical protein VFL56_04680 [Solirubrobacterales bacterium]|nr:hypothetical protein [Solirubrobacterales bacterium]